MLATWSAANPGHVSDVLRMTSVIFMTCNKSYSITKHDLSCVAHSNFDIHHHSLLRMRSCRPPLHLLVCARLFNLSGGTGCKIVWLGFSVAHFPSLFKCAHAWVLRRARLRTCPILAHLTAHMPNHAPKFQSQTESCNSKTKESFNLTRTSLCK